MNRAVYLCALGLSRLARLMPWPVLKAASAVLGSALYCLVPFRRAMVFSNIRKTLCTDRRETARIARASYVNTVRVFMETFKFRDTLPPVSVHGAEHLERARARGKGVIIITGHIGNWELAGAALSRMCPIHAVARRIKNPYLDAWIRESRENNGIRQIYKSGSALNNRHLFKALRANEAVALIIDQYRPGGHETLFMGIGTRVPEGPYRLAKLTGAAVIPAFLVMQPDGTYRGQFHPEIEFTACADPETELAVNTRKYMLAIEDEIRAHPEQWFWFHNRFKKSGLTASKDSVTPLPS